MRSSDSVQPVHSWKWSQMTEGFFPFATFSAIFSPAQAGRPTAPAAMEQTLMKSRREKPSFNRAGGTSRSIWFIERPPCQRHTTKSFAFYNYLNFRIFLTIGCTQ